MQQNSAQTQKQAVLLTTCMNVKCWVKEADTIGNILCEIQMPGKLMCGDGIGRGSACRGAQGPLLGGAGLALSSLWLLLGKPKPRHSHSQDRSQSLKGGPCGLPCSGPLNSLASSGEAPHQPQPHKAALACGCLP